eukprot:5658490-Pyramimonas_sp.AAC.1
MDPGGPLPTGLAPLDRASRHLPGRRPRPPTAAPSSAAPSAPPPSQGPRLAAALQGAAAAMASARSESKLVQRGGSRLGPTGRS